MRNELLNEINFIDYIQKVNNNLFEQNQILMTTVYPYTQKISRLYYCSKGQSHSQLPLNIVCLDKICKDSPLACSSCFNQYHKYHKTIALDLFLSDYQAAIKRNNVNMVRRKIHKEKQKVKIGIRNFRDNLTKSLDSYQQSVDSYFTFLQKSLNVRDQLASTLNLTLQPKLLRDYTKSAQQLQQSLIFILSHSLFNQQARLTNISSILKHDQSRTLALLDKIVNQNLKCQRNIESNMKKLNFTQQVIGNESHRLQGLVYQFNKHQSNEEKGGHNSHQFVLNEQFNSTLSLNTRRLFQQNSISSITKNQQILQFISNQNKKIVNQDAIFEFGKHKHEMLAISSQNGKSTLLKSSISALKPQYGLISPSMDCHPQKQQNWSIKIKNCRNFSSKNTLAVGLSTLLPLEQNNFEQTQAGFHNYLITSQGYLLKEGRTQKCNFTYGQGDTIHLKYDPYYHLLIVYKDNGRKITIKTNTNNNQLLYGCVRLTYASDQVQLLNHH